MYPTDTANISDGSANHVYSLVKMGETEISSVRRESAAPADQPATLGIKHREVGKGLTTEAQSMIRFDRVVEDASGNQGTVTCMVKLTWPNKVCTAATAQKSLNEALAFFAVSGYKDKFTNLEP